MSALRGSFGIASLLVVVSLTSGCKYIQERLAKKADHDTIEGASSAQVDPQGGQGTVTLTGENGGVIAVGGENVKVPDTWPKSVPPYPTGTLKGSMSATGAQATGKIHHTLTYETPDDATKVMQFYTENLKGFTKSSELNLGGNLIASFEGDGKVVAITVSKTAAANVSMINVMVTDKT